MNFLRVYLKCTQALIKNGNGENGKRGSRISELSNAKPEEAMQCESRIHIYILGKVSPVVLWKCTVQVVWYFIMVDSATAASQNSACVKRCISQRKSHLLIMFSQLFLLICFYIGDSNTIARYERERKL